MREEPLDASLTVRVTRLEQELRRWRAVGAGTALVLGVERPDHPIDLAAWYSTRRSTRESEERPYDHREGAKGAWLE